MRAMAAIIPSGAVIGRPFLDGSAHDVAIGQCGGFREAEDSIGKTMTPVRKTLLQPSRPRIRIDLLYAESDFRDRYGRQRLDGRWYHAVLLLDTQLVLWTAFWPNKIPRQAAEAIERASSVYI
jgi:hypothetical protein